MAMLNMFNLRPWVNPLASKGARCDGGRACSTGEHLNEDDCLLGLKVAEAHERGRGKYGSPRVHRELKKQGFEVSRKRVIRLMQDQGLVGRPKRRFVVATDSEHQLELAPN